MSAETTRLGDSGVDALFRRIAQRPAERALLGLHLAGLQRDHAVKRQIAALREELDALRAQLAEHSQRLAELHGLLTAAIAVLRSPTTADEDLELTPEAKAELDRLADWPFVDEYPIIRGT